MKKKNVKNQCWVGPMWWLNQLIKSIWKVAHLENSLLYMLGENKYQSNEKWPRLGLLKRRPTSNH
jgi:hypothetical protein